MDKRPFEMDSVVILPDHIHCIWNLPEGDADFSTRWKLIKRNFSAGIAAPIHIKRKTADYLARMSRKKTRVVLSSGGLEPVADSEGQGKYSAFASAFINVLKENKGVMDGTGFFVKIRRLVMLATEQTPEYADIRKAGHDGGDFLFVR